MNKLFELIKTGVITTRLVTLIVIGTAVYMWVTGMVMGETQKVITVMIVGFYFGGETFTKFSKHLLDEYIKHFEEKH